MTDILSELCALRARDAEEGARREPLSALLARPETSAPAGAGKRQMFWRPKLPSETATRPCALSCRKAGVDSPFGIA